MRKDIKEIFMYALAGLLIFSILTIVAILIYVPIPEPNKEILYIVIGSLLTAFITVVTFFFGSSKGSADKTELMNKENK